MQLTERSKIEKDRVLLKGHYGREAIEYLCQMPEWKKFVNFFQYFFGSQNYNPYFKARDLFFLHPYRKEYYDPDEVDSIMHFSDSEPEFFMHYDDTQWKQAVAMILMEFKLATIQEVHTHVSSFGGIPAGRNDLISLYLTVRSSGLPNKIILATLPMLEGNSHIMSLQQYDGPLFSVIEPGLSETWSGSHYLFAAMLPLG